MKEYKFKLMIMKKYFDLGYGLTNYFFKLVAVFGLTTQLAKTTFIILFIYSISCYFIGRIYCKYHWFEVETEINNRFNPFVKEMRKIIVEPNNQKI